MLELVRRIKLILCNEKYIYVVEGIAAFFLKKFTKPKKAATYRRPPKSAHSITQPIIPTEINTFDDPYGMEGTTGQGIIGTYIPRNVSANSGIYFV